ncbi:MAG: GAF domain-containing protein [Rhizomicrobium sp.]
MFEAATISSADPPEFYTDLARQLEGLLKGERDAIANAANMSALIFNVVPDLNWAGFYFRKGTTLVVGPFQGAPACVRIALGKGVCGTAAAGRQSLRVDDVAAFSGHIACDSRSRSELVIPLIRDDRVLGVLDLDSAKPARFSAWDQQGFERLAAIYLADSDLV